MSHTNNGEPSRGSPELPIDKNRKKYYFSLWKDIAKRIVARDSSPAEPRASQSQQSEEQYKFKTIYEPKGQSDVDIVAVHGLSETGDKTWIFNVPAKTREPARTTSKISIPNIVAEGEGLGKKVYTKAMEIKEWTIPAQDPLDTSHTTQSTKQSSRPETSGASGSSIRSNNTAATTTVNWLGDNNMLPRSFPRARIITFSYPRGLAKDPLADLNDVVSNLLDGLREKRKDYESGLSRPIVFIGHGFGGIVISKALINAQEGQYPGLTSSTAGLVFLGTPFRGSKEVVLRLKTAPPSKPITSSQKDTDLRRLAHSNAAKTSTATSMQKKSDAAPLYMLLDPESNNAATLTDIRKELKQVAANQNIPIACFYEKFKTEVLSFEKKILIDENSATLKGYSGRYYATSLSCSHPNLSKFSGCDDPNFIRVRRSIKIDIDHITTRCLWNAISKGVQANIKEIEMQLGRRADIDRKNAQGRNALHLAVITGRLDIVNLLLQSGVKVRCPDDPKPPLLLAIDAGHFNIVRALLIRGALADGKDRDDAKAHAIEMKNKTPSMSGIADLIINLIVNFKYIQGPLVKPKAKIIHPGSHSEPPTPECRTAASKFSATITTFRLRCENDTEELESNPKPLVVLPDSGIGTGSKNAAVDTADKRSLREYHAVEKWPVSDLLYQKTTIDAETFARDPTPSGDEWKWYHLPANNMEWVEALFVRCGIENEDKRLSGQEHRGPFPHTRFLQPQASVIKRDENKEDKFLFMPYLHFETNEGRIRLSNAVKRTMDDSLKVDPSSKGNEMELSEETDTTSNLSSLSKLESQSDTESVSESDEQSSGTKIPFKNDDDPSDTEPEEVHDENKDEKPVHRIKRKLRSFRKAIRRCREELWLDAHEKPSAEDHLVEAYLTLDKHQFHIRRTLDQFYYIGMENTEGRDRNQVVQRYSVKEIENISEDHDQKLRQKKLIMVDQLWLWVLGKDTIITSFPQCWSNASSSGDDTGDKGNILNEITEYLGSTKRDAITSVDVLASVIIKKCTQVFGRFQDPKHGDLQFFDFFDASISDVADRHSKIFEELDVSWDIPKELAESIKKNKMGGNRQAIPKQSKKQKQFLAKRKKAKKAKQESQLDISEEVELLVEIQDIRDELNIIKIVLDDQYFALSPPPGEVEREREKEKSQQQVLHATFPLVAGRAVDSYIKDNLKTIERMAARAKDVYDAVYRLIDLKQKQANIAEARSSREAAMDTAKEGKTILALTIVNMIFLPLSFMSSFFALDIVEFPKDSTGQTVLHLPWVSQYVFGISIAVAIPSIAIALAIGPYSSEAKRSVHKIMKWVKAAPLLTVQLLFVVGLIVLIPVVAVIIFAAGVVAVGLALALLPLLIIIYLCLVIWRFTYQRTKQARRKKERDDVEIAAARNEVPENKNHDYSTAEGDGREAVEREDKTDNEKGIMVSENVMGGQLNSGGDNEIEEVH